MRERERERERESVSICGTWWTCKWDHIHTRTRIVEYFYSHSLSEQLDTLTLTHTYKLCFDNTYLELIAVNHESQIDI